MMRMIDLLRAVLLTLEQNHSHHNEYDDTGTYADSDMFEANDITMRNVRERIAALERSELESRMRNRMKLAASANEVIQCRIVPGVYLMHNRDDAHRDAILSIAGQVFWFRIQTHQREPRRDGGYIPTQYTGIFQPAQDGIPEILRGRISMRHLMPVDMSTGENIEPDLIEQPTPAPVIKRRIMIED